MSASYKSSNSDYGELMACLMKQRHRYRTEEEFKAFAVEAVRRFITDLRALSIEISMRPNSLEKTSAPYRMAEELTG
jgi:hypothetical protein